MDEIVWRIAAAFMIVVVGSACGVGLFMFWLSQAGGENRSKEDEIADKSE